MAITNILWYAKQDHDTVQENFTVPRAEWLNQTSENLLHLYIDFCE